MRSADIGLLAAAFVLSAAITGLVRTYAQRVNLLDVPNQRSSHEVSTPRGGGLGIVLVFLGASVMLWATGRLEYETAVASLLGGGLIAAIGFVDDHSHVSSGWRFLVQIIAATIAVMVLGGLPEIQFGKTAVDLGLAGDLLAIFFMVWFTNAFNFMDGIDGIAASEAAFIAVGALVAFAAGSTVGVLLGVLAAASLGFLVWNWPPAKIFLGDVGSAFLGFIVIVLAIRATADVQPVGLAVADTGRRVHRGCDGDTGFPNALASRLDIGTSKPRLSESFEALRQPSPGDRGSPGAQRCLVTAPCYRGGTLASVRLVAYLCRLDSAGRAVAVVGRRTPGRQLNDIVHISDHQGWIMSCI